MKSYRYLSALGLLGCLLPGGCSDASESREAAKEAPVVARALLSALAKPEDEVRVIIQFREAAAEPPAPGTIAKMQHSLLAREMAGLTVTHRYKSVAAVAGTIRRDALERLKDDPSIASIEVDEPGTGHLKEAVPAIGGDRVRNVYGLTGKGVRVAVLDTGIDPTHPDLRDSLVAQHCFTQRACHPSRTAEGTSAADDHGHGSNATGIIASNGVVAPRGYAPDVELVSVKVNDQNNAGYESDWVAGLDWIYDNLATLKVKVVNMSLGTNAMHPADGSCDTRHTAMVRAIRNLTDAGVVVFAATGNAGSAVNMSSPACNTGAIAVGAVYDSTLPHQPPGAATYFARWGGNFARCGDDNVTFDTITCFTNSNAKMDIVAPGAPITSDSIRGRTETYWGTSQASPAAAGVAALMLQCNPALTPAQIKEHLLKTGVPRVDPKNGRSFPSLRADLAVRAACPDIEEEAAPEDEAPGVTGALRDAGGAASRDLRSGASPARAAQYGGDGLGRAQAPALADPGGDLSEPEAQASQGGCTLAGEASFGEAPLFFGMALAGLVGARRRRRASAQA